jgi:hypothetical protein
VIGEGDEEHDADGRVVLHLEQSGIEKAKVRERCCTHGERYLHEIYQKLCCLKKVENLFRSVSVRPVKDGSRNSLMPDYNRNSFRYGCVGVKHALLA